MIVSDATLYQDRLSAGEALAEAVADSLVGVESPVRVYALPRGGIPVAAPIAQRLNCPLEVLASKKISLPRNSELALGAVTPDGTTVWSKYPHLQRQNQKELEKARERALASAIAQQEQFNPHCPAADVKKAIVLIVDDGIATGMTMMTAVAALRKKQPAQIWIAAPFAPPEIKPQLLKYSDRAIILHTPDPFINVGRFYANFPQVSIEEAISYLTGDKQ
mgnify:FL=1